MRYLFTKELVPLLDAAQELGQHAHVMTVLGAGFGFPIRTTDLGLHEAHTRSINFLQGVLPVRSYYSIFNSTLNFISLTFFDTLQSFAAIKALLTGVTYNDGLVAVCVFFTQDRA
jgi:hypothetical protein